ncbi:MAG: TorF family putative porin, partial [Xanthobacteraceae bacterium]|nr:TorF family putative porin [Xanthobacteraceae bacterium]
MRGKMKKAIILGAGSLALLLAGPAMAADAPVRKAPAAAAATPPPPPFDIAFGAAVSNDYNFRGVSQSNRKWSGGGYIEPQWNGPWGQFYVGVAGWRMEMPNTPTYGFTDMPAEIDLYGG